MVEPDCLTCNTVSCQLLNQLVDLYLEKWGHVRDREGCKPEEREPGGLLSEAIVPAPSQPLLTPSLSSTRSLPGGYQSSLACSRFLYSGSERDR